MVSRGQAAGKYRARGAAASAGRGLLSEAGGGPGSWEEQRAPHTLYPIPYTPTRLRSGGRGRRRRRCARRPGACRRWPSRCCSTRPRSSSRRSAGAPPPAPARAFRHRGVLLAMTANGEGTLLGIGSRNPSAGRRRASSACGGAAPGSSGPRRCVLSWPCCCDRCRMATCPLLVRSSTSCAYPTLHPDAHWRAHARACAGRCSSWRTSRTPTSCSSWARALRRAAPCS